MAIPWARTVEDTSDDLHVRDSGWRAPTGGDRGSTHRRGADCQLPPQLLPITIAEQVI